MTWDEYYLDMARLTAKKSKDPSTKCGAVIVGKNNEVRAIGFNGIPRNCTESERRNTRPIKYSFYEHAERNAIYNAARVGIPLEDCKIYITGAPCCDCARAIIQSGIGEVIFPKVDEQNGFVQRWQESIDIGNEMFLEADIFVRQV